MLLFFHRTQYKCIFLLLSSNLVLLKFGICAYATLPNTFKCDTVNYFSTPSLLLDLHVNIDFEYTRHTGLRLPKALRETFCFLSLIELCLRWSNFFFQPHRSVERNMGLLKISWSLVLHNTSKKHLTCILFLHLNARFWSPSWSFSLPALEILECL